MMILVYFYEQYRFDLTRERDAPLYNISISKVVGHFRINATIFLLSIVCMFFMNMITVPEVVFGVYFSLFFADCTKDIFKNK